MGYTNIKRMASSPVTGPKSNKATFGPPLKKMGTFPGNKQEAGGKWPGHRTDWISSSQNRKGGNYPHHPMKHKM